MSDTERRYIVRRLQFLIEEIERTGIRNGCVPSWVNDALEFAGMSLYNPGLVFQLKKSNETFSDVIRYLVKQERDPRNLRTMFPHI